MPSSLLFISTVNNSKTIPFISGLNQVVRSPFSPFLDLNTHFWFYLLFFNSEIHVIFADDISRLTWHMVNHLS